MLMFIDFLLAGTEIGMCAGHLYPALLEQPTIIVLHFLVAATHCMTVGCHYNATRREKH
jgi:hypothetical protein